MYELFVMRRCQRYCLSNKRDRWPRSICSGENGCSSSPKSPKLPLECIFFGKYVFIVSMLLLLRGDFAGKNVGTPKRCADAHQFTSHMNQNQEHSSHEQKHIERLSSQDLSV